MRKLFKNLLSIFVLMFSIKTGYSFTRVSPEEAGKLLETKKATLLFLGSAAESKTLPLQGAVPLTFKELKYKAYYYLKGREYVVVIASQEIKDSEEGAALLEKDLYKKVYVLVYNGEVQQNIETDTDNPIITDQKKTDKKDTKVIDPPQVKNITTLNVYKFEPKTSTIIKGLEVEKRKTDDFMTDETIGDLGLAALFYQNGCYTTGTYNHNDFKVEKGIISDSQNQRFDGYRIYPPSHKATKFLASRHGVYFRFPEKKDYIIYELSGTKVEKIAVLNASEIQPGKFNLIPGLEVSTISSPKTYFFAAADIRISPFFQIAERTEAAVLEKFPDGKLLKFKYPVSTQLVNMTAGVHIRNYFPVMATGGRPAIIYQDNSNKKVYITTMNPDLTFEKNTALPLIPSATLIAADTDDQGNIYLAYIKKVSGFQEDKLVLLKADKNGKELRRNNPDTSQSALNIWDPGDYPASLRYSKGKLALLVARRMFKSGDGLNHQGGIAVVFDAETLAVVINTGQTSGHSFDNYLTVDSQGDFLAIDLGDNYPRGINLHRFFDQKRISKIVYTFKTLHGTTPKSPAGKTYPAYPEISTGTKQFYKWSNDNGVYTELGSVLETPQGLLVIFAGEPSPEGKSIDNSRTGGTVQDTRNLGFVLVRKDFEKSSGKGNVVSDDLVLSPGKEETGGFYSFGGGWSEQRNKGVNWLTHYTSPQTGSVRRVKAVILPNNDVYVFYELYKTVDSTPDYQDTYLLILDDKGRIKSGPLSLGSHVRLSPRDDILVMGNRILIPSADPVDQKLEWIDFEAGKY